MMVSIQQSRKDYPFLQHRYVKPSTSRFYNYEIGKIDGSLIHKEAKKDLLNYELEHYLHVGKSEIEHMTRDEYMLACSKAGLIERHKIKVLSLANENAMARVLNAMLGKGK